MYLPQFNDHGSHRCGKPHPQEKRSVTSGGLPQRSRALLACLAMATLLCAGCTTPLSRWAHQRFKVGPDYCPPPAPVSDAWIDARDPDVVSEETDYSYWWAVFNDPVLNDLQATARQQNLPLRIAGTRIVEARARLAIARGSLFPQFQQAFGDYSRTQVSQTIGNRLPIVALDTWDTGFNASWELDIWGRFRRNIESAGATLDARIESRDDVLVILQGEVAAAYIQMRAFQRRLQLAEANVALQEETLELADIRFRKGAVTELDPAQAKENLASTQALIPPLQTGVRQTQNAISILLGMPPHDLDEALGPGPIPESPTEAIVGIPADLLRRRPDVRRAERLAAAQSARIGIAESDLYPRFAITGFVGYQAANLSDLFQKNSFNGSVGPGFQWNILNYGRIRNNVRAEEARFCELVLDYQNTVLEANREVEDSIDAFLREKQRVTFLTDSVQSAQRAVELATIQYRDGAVDFQRVVDMERILVVRQDALAESRGNVATNFVSIYKGLGGGWATRYAPQRLPSVEVLDTGVQ